MFNSKQIKRAWNIRREAAVKFGCGVMEISWKECLKMVNEGDYVKADLSILRGESVCKKWEKIDAGLFKNGKFFFNEHITKSYEKHNSLYTDFGFSYCELSVDIESGYYTHNGEYDVDKRDIEGFHKWFKFTVLKEFREKAGKVSYSRFTQKETMCNTIFHCFE